LHAQVKLGNGAVIRCDVDAAAARAGDPVTLGIRPEHFTIGGPQNLLETTVTFVESLGSITHAYCAFPGVEEALTTELDGRLRVKSGEALTLSVPSESCYLFDAKGMAFTRRVPAERSLAA
jgi:multiple sugar transport system ATP-binding protein